MLIGRRKFSRIWKLYRRLINNQTVVNHIKSSALAFDKSYHLSLILSRAPLARIARHASAHESEKNETNPTADDEIIALNTQFCVRFERLKAPVSVAKKNGKNYLPLVLSRALRLGKYFLVHQEASLLCTMRKSYAFAVWGMLENLPLKMPSHRNSITSRFWSGANDNVSRTKCAGRFELRSYLVMPITPKNILVCPLSSAMNHCNCWRWKIPKKIQTVSSAWAIYWKSGSAIGAAARRNSTSTSSGRTITSKFSRNFKCHRCHSRAISYCRRWHSSGPSTALSSSFITPIRRQRWFISWYVCSTTRHSQSPKAFSTS